MSKKRRNILVIGYWTSSWPSVHMWAFISSSSISVRDMLCSSCCLLPPLMSAVSLCVSICFQWGRGREREEGRIEGRKEGRKGERKVNIWVAEGYCSFWNEWSLSTVGTSWRPQDSGGSEGHGRMRLQRTLGKNLCYEESQRWAHDGKMGIWGEYELWQDQGGRARIYKHRKEEYLWCSSARCIFAWPLHYLYSDIKIQTISWIFGEERTRCEKGREGA